MASNGHSAPKPNAVRVAPSTGQVVENRDPNNLNDHLDMQFYSVFAEPSTSPQSASCTWEFSEIMYDCCLLCWYKLFSFFCGICIAIYWGLQMVPLLFSHVWCLTPVTSLFHMVCGVWCRTYWLICTRCCIKPFANAFSYFFHMCGDGHLRRVETPPIFPKSRPRPKAVKEETQAAVNEEPAKIVVIPMKGAFDDYDKEKVARSVKRQLMLY